MSKFKEIVLILSMGCFFYCANIDDKVCIYDLNNFLIPDTLKTIIDNPVECIWIVDVRSESEYANGFIPTAINIPSDIIETKLNEIPVNQYLIVYCQSGFRSGYVVETLINNGYQNVLNWGSITRWPYALEQ